MSLYLTYRSHTFDDIVEQTHITTILKTHVMHPPSRTNYLFYGPRWTGKTSCARIFARGLNCLSPRNGSPCNTCNNCMQTDPTKERESFDIIEIDAASQTGVDNVREEIIAKAIFPPTGGMKKKVYIIDEVHMLSKSAFNALLKIMEEPPNHVVFILATTEIHKVIPTILSRCQIYTFHHISQQGICNRLRHIATQEHITIDDPSLALLAKMSWWCMRDAIKYLDQVALPWISITPSHITSMLGIASDADINHLISLILSHDQTAITTIQSLLDQGILLDTLLDDLALRASTNLATAKQILSFVLTVRQTKKYLPTSILACIYALTQNG